MKESMLSLKEKTPQHFLQVLVLKIL